MDIAHNTILTVHLVFSLNYGLFQFWAVCYKAYEVFIIDAGTNEGGNYSRAGTINFISALVQSTFD